MMRAATMRTRMHYAAQPRVMRAMRLLYVHEAMAPMLRENARSARQHDYADCAVLTRDAAAP